MRLVSARRPIACVRSETVEECIEEEACGIRDTFTDVRDAMLQILNDTSVADIINKENRFILGT